jgi:hypothetical protein
MRRVRSSVLGTLMPGPSPDALYADRTNLASAQAAADAWAAELAQRPSDLKPRGSWRARITGWAATRPRRNGARFLTRGIEAGRRAIAASPNQPEGHFWAAANMGALAEASGIRGGLKYRRPIKDELEWVLRVAPAFLQGSADRALGRWYFKVPALLGGSKMLAEAHLRASLKHNAHSTASHFFLAELLLDDGRVADARAELQQVLDAPLDPDWTPEDREFKVKAQALLDRTAGR